MDPLLLQQDGVGGVGGVSSRNTISGGGDDAGGGLDVGSAPNAEEDLASCAPVAVAPEGTGCEEAMGLLAQAHAAPTAPSIT